MVVKHEMNSPRRLAVAALPCSRWHGVVAHQSWVALALWRTKLDGDLLKTKRGLRRFLPEVKIDGVSHLGGVAAVTSSSGSLMACVTEPPQK
jgi:hypothetical protein